MELMEKNAELMKELEALNVAVNERRHIHDISGLVSSYNQFSLSLIRIFPRPVFRGGTIALCTYRAPCSGS